MPGGGYGGGDTGSGYGGGGTGPYAQAGEAGATNGGGGGGGGAGGSGGAGGNGGASGGGGGNKTHRNGYAGGDQSSGTRGAGGGGGGYNGYVGTGTLLIFVATGGNGGAGGAGRAGGGGGGGSGGYGAVVSGTQIENKTQVTGGIGGVGGSSADYYARGTHYPGWFGRSGSGGAGLYVLNAGAKVTQDSSGLATGGAGGAGAAYSFNQNGGGGGGGNGIIFKGLYSSALSNTGVISGGSGGAGGYTGYGGGGGDGIVNRQADSVYNAGGAQGGAGGRGLYEGYGGAGVYFAGRAVGGTFVNVTLTNSGKGTIAGGAGGSYSGSSSGNITRVGANGGDGVLFGRYSSGTLTNAGLIEGGAAHGFLATGGAGVAVTTAPIKFYTYYSGGSIVQTYTTSTTVTNNSTGTIRGGYGNYGGAGVLFVPTGLRGTLVNAGAIIGGSAPYLDVGGAGVVGENLTIIDTGQISGTTGADAIIFTGGKNILAFGANAGLVGDSALTGAIDIESGTLTFNQSAGTAEGASASVTVADTIIGTGTVIQDCPGVLTLTGDNSFSGDINIAAGVLSISADDNLGASADGVVLQGGTLRTTASFSSARSILLTSNSRVDVETSNTSLTGIIAGSYGLVKSGPGTLTLSGDNQYFGGTTIDAGVVSIAADDNLGAASGSLTLADGTLQTTAGFASARTISLTTNGTIDVEGGPVLLSGVISGAGGFAKAGGGTLTLLNTESYTGQTTISAGTLQLGNGATDGSLAGPIIDNAVLALDPHNTQSFAEQISGSVGTLSKIGAGTAVLTYNSGFSGQTTIRDGTLQFGDGTTNGSVRGPIADNSVLALDPYGVQTYGQTISGAGSLSKIGTGTAILTGTDSYAGRTTISAGTLQFGNGAHEGSVAGQIVDDAVLSVDPGSSQSFANRITGSGMLIVQSGTVDLTSDDTYSGGTEIDAGATLEIGKDDKAGSGSASNATLAFEGTHAALLVDAGATYDAASQTITTDDGREYTVSLPAGTTLDAIPQSGGATMFTEQTLCFGNGTHIRVVRDGHMADIAVTSLRVGDLAVTASGAQVPVRWIGHRALDETLLAAHPESGPVQILPGAFGENLPARLLTLSPGHPVLVGADLDGQGGVLVPIMCLINGTSVARASVRSVEYWHVELERHDILLAEGLPAESFLDYGTRSWFENGADHALTNPDFIPPGLNGRCRPVATEGALVEAERRRINTLFAVTLERQCKWPSSNMDLVRVLA